MSPRVERRPGSARLAPRAFAWLAFVVVAAIAVGAAADPAKRRVTLLVEGCFGPQRGAIAGARFARPIDRARPALAACHEIAQAEAPEATAEITADLRVAPNGDVAAVTLAVRGHVPETAIACFRRALQAIVFDPPDAGVATVSVPILLGDPPADRRPDPLPFRTESGSFFVRVPPMRLRAPPPPTAVRAVGALVRAAEACAAAIAPATAVTVDAHLLVASTGDLARVEARSDAAGGEAIVRCLTGTVVGPPRGRVTRLDLRLVVGPAGKVTVAR